MKKLLLTLTVVTAVALTTFGQGRVLFSNSTFSNPDAITVGAENMGPAGGNPGDGLGNDKYSVQLLWKVGTFANQAAFDAAIPSASTVFNNVFLVNTGPLATFSGFFDAGTVVTGADVGTHTMQVLAWYNVGNATYAAAVGNGGNVGKSALFTMNVTASPTPINTTPMPGFTVGIVPEPSTFALAGLGLAGLLIFRRRK